MAIPARGSRRVDRAADTERGAGTRAGARAGTCPSGSDRMMARHRKGRPLERDTLTGLFREGLIGGLSYTQPTRAGEPCEYDALEVRPRRLRFRGARLGEFSWPWTAI